MYRSRKNASQVGGFITDTYNALTHDDDIAYSVDNAGTATQLAGGLATSAKLGFKTAKFAFDLGRDLANTVTNVSVKKTSMPFGAAAPKMQKKKDGKNGGLLLFSLLDRVSLPRVVLPAFDFAVGNFDCVSIACKMLGVGAIPTAYLGGFCLLLSWLQKEEIEGEWMLSDNRSLVCDVLNANGDAEKLSAIYQLRKAAKEIPLEVDSIPQHLLSQIEQLPMLRNQAETVHTMRSLEVSKLYKEHSKLPVFRLSHKVGRSFVEAMEQVSRGYRYIRYSIDRPHPECGHARSLLVTMAVREMSELGMGINAVGASVAQVALIEGIAHNCSPTMTGRDVDRIEGNLDALARAHHARVSCDEPFEQCRKVARAGIFFLPLSAPDIHMDSLLKKMMECQSRYAYVITHGPLPFCRSDVTDWVDDILGVRFQREGKKTHMTYLRCGSAGYTNRTDRVLSWFQPPTYCVGHHVMVEEKAHVGSMFLLKITLSPGDQEEYPIAFSNDVAKFYQLPYVTGDRAGETFTLRARKFEAVVKYCEISPNIAGELFESVANKVRGLESEILIGNKVVNEAWTLDLDVFNSVVAHALTAARIKGGDARRYCLDVDNPWRRYNPKRVIGDYVKRHLFNWQRFDTLNIYKPIDSHRYIRRARTVGWTNFLAGANCEFYECEEGWNATRIATFLATSRKDDEEEEEEEEPKGKEEEMETKMVEQPEENGEGPSLGGETEEKGLAAGDQEDSETDSESEEELEVESWEDSVEWHDGLLLALRDHPQQQLRCLDYTSAELDALRTTTKIDFGGQPSFAPVGTPAQVEFASLFSSLGDITTTDCPFTVPAPDKGLLSILEHLLARRDCGRMERAGHLQALQEMVIPAEDKKSGQDEISPDGLRECLERYQERANRLARGAGAIDGPHCVILGVPAAAKSTLVRQLLKSANRVGVVVVPTRKLAEDWRTRLAKEHSVVTMHKIGNLPNCTTHLVVDEFNRMDKHVLVSWCILAKRANVPCIFLGDRYQTEMGTARKLTEGIVNMSLVIEMRNTFNMPADALKLYCETNGLDVQKYRTSSNVRRSIVVVDGQVDERAYDLPLRARVLGDNVTLGGVDLDSVTQSQGTRSQLTLFRTELPERKWRWFQDRVALRSVLVSRHSEGLVIEGGTKLAGVLLRADLRNTKFVNSNSLSMKKQIRAFFPGYQDYVPRIVSANPAAVAHPSFPWCHSSFYEEKLVPENLRDQLPISADFVSEHSRQIAPLGSLVSSFIQDHSAEVAPRQYAEEIPAHFDEAHGLKRLGEVGWGKDPQMRVKLDGALTLGDVQMSRDRTKEVDNLIKRQLNEEKPYCITDADVQRAHKLLDLYKKSFCRTEYPTTTFRATAYDYIVNRTPQFIAAWNDPFGFTAHTLDYSGFLKGQLKFKPGEAGKIQKGQSIIASHPAAVNRFSVECRKVTQHMRDTDRLDFITDVGLSDRELGTLARERGILARICRKGRRNLQVDLSSQDSTHRAAHTLAFAMFAVEAGCDPMVMETYVWQRSRAHVKSMSPNLYRAVIGDNLESGDPFTLIANCFMMKCCLAVEYEGLENCAGFQKGDDFISSDEGYFQSDRHGLREALRYKMKIEEDKAPYHAGRFLTPERFLADPVRAFAKHYCKLYDPGVSIESLWVSYCDRATDYTVAEREYLLAACAALYVEFNSGEIEMIIDTVMALRCFKFFKSTYKHQSIPDNKIFSPSGDCAYRVAQHVLPSLRRPQLCSFRYLEPAQLYQRFLAFGVEATVVQHLCELPQGHRGVVIYRDHCFVRY